MLKLRLDYGNPLAVELIFSEVKNLLNGRNPIICCVGTDRSTGDSLGPLVGHLLKQKGYLRVYGTLDNPIHAENMRDILPILPKNQPIIAVDATLGKRKNIGSISVVSGPIYPGKELHKDLPPIGEVGITGTVNVSGFMEYFVLASTRLSLVMRMAETISEALDWVLFEG